MDWTDDGIVLTVRRHGESSAIVSLLTAQHGRHAGLVRGGASRRNRGTLQPGNQVFASWRARLEQHLGTYSIEPVRSNAALYDRPGPLAALASATALVEATLPERAPHPDLFRVLTVLLDALGHPGWGAAYVRWELSLLAELGFGLDLSECAATGANDSLAYVSPRSGRAVSLSAGEPWRNRLLPLPGFLTPAKTAAAPGDIRDGLALTGWFLARHVFEPHGAKTPMARERLVTFVRGLDVRRQEIV